MAEVNYVVKAIKCNKSAGSDGISGDLIEYGGKPICEMLLTLFNLLWNPHVITYWREGLAVSWFRKGCREDHGIYKDTTIALFSRLQGSICPIAKYNM